MKVVIQNLYLQWIATDRWAILRSLTTNLDNYAKDGGPGKFWLLCSFYHEPLRSWIKTNVNKFATSSHTALKLGTQSLRSYLKVTCEYELQILKLVPQKIMVKTK